MPDKWRIWRDFYEGDRQEISSPQFEGQEFSGIKEVKEYLSSLYCPEDIPFLVWDEDDEYIFVYLEICYECRQKWPCPEHGNIDYQIIPWTLLSYHAERVIVEQ